MFKKMKTIGLLLGLIVLALAGCGSSEESTGTDKNSETVTSETKSASNETKKASKNSLIAKSFEEDIKIISEDSLELTKESYEFIVKNYNLFPANSKKEIAEAKKKADSSISAKQLNKNAQPYFKKIATFQGTVITIEENPLENGVTVSLVHVMDDDMNSYQVLLYKSTGDILEEDRVRFWGVPVGASSFENVSGGTTNIQNFLGSHIEKVN